MVGIRRRLRPVWRRCRNAAIVTKSKISPWEPENGQVNWLFVATLPNSGSTALAQLLATAKSAVTLLDNGEGQFLVPQLIAGNTRWNANLAVDYDRVRAVWMHEIRKQSKFPCIVVEKSPPSLVRMRSMMGTFSDMPSSLIRFTRDPYAVCASWASRYSPATFTNNWGENAGHLKASDLEFYQLLGDVYGRRAALLCDLADSAAMTISYENLTENPEAAVSALTKVSPLLSDIKLGANLAVKDYQPQPLQNMNDRQISKLLPDQIDAISKGLSKHEQHIVELGYSLR